MSPVPSAIPDRQLEFDQGTLVLRGTDLMPTIRPTDDPGWMWDPRIDAWRCDAFHYGRIVKSLRSNCPDLCNRVPQWERLHWPRVSLPQLRPEQQSALAQWMTNRNGIIVMPTGTGKTEVALSAMQGTSVSTLVVAPVRDLMYQWHRRILHGLGFDAGIIGDQIYRVRSVSVTTYDSACIHMPRFGDRFALIIFDECHHLPGPMRSDAARMSSAPFRLGLTATLHRADGRHALLEDWIGPTVFDLPLSQVAGRSLADYEVVRIPVYLQPEEQSRYDALSLRIREFMAQHRKESSTFRWQDVCAMSTESPEAREVLKAHRMKQSIEDRAEEKLRVLEDLFRLHADVPVLVFAGSNAMARDVSRRFLIPCLLHHCGKAERMDILDGLVQRRYPAVVANQVLDEGVDIPAVKIGVVLGGSGSTRQSRQRLGRILRRVGDSRATLYEVVCTDTNEATRSRKRRKDDAFQGTRHRRL